MENIGNKRYEKLVKTKRIALSCFIQSAKNDREKLLQAITEVGTFTVYNQLKDYYISCQMEVTNTGYIINGIVFPYIHDTVHYMRSYLSLRGNKK